MITSSNTLNLITYCSFGFGILSFIFTIIAFAYAIYCRHKTKEVEIKQRTINWSDVNIATQYLANQIKYKYSPDIIYIPSIKSGIIVHFIKEYFTEYTPIIVGQMIPKKQFSVESIQKIKNHEQYLFFETNKWYAFIPRSILDYKTEKMLIIDDFAMSGDFLDLLSQKLLENGFAPQNIMTACIATTEVAVKSNKAPNVHWRIFDTIDVYMPWGKPI